MLDRHNWKSVSDEPEAFLDSLNGSLTELMSVAQQTIELKWLESPTTYATLEKFVQETSRLIDVTESKLIRINELRKKKNSAIVAVDELKHARRLVNGISRYIDSGFLDLATKHADTKKSIESCAKLLRSYDDEFITIITDIETKNTVTNSLKFVSKKRFKAETEFSTAKKEYSEFNKLRDDSIKLSQQLRQIAGTLIQRAENPDECPLCHTQFEAGELARHMSFGVDNQHGSSWTVIGAFTYA